MQNVMFLYKKEYIVLGSNQKIILIVFLVCVGLHFTISIISAHQISKAIDVSILDRGIIPEEIRRNPEKAKQWFENELKNKSGYWQPVFHVFNHYPIGWLITPITKKIGQENRNKYFNEQSITSRQYWIITYVVAFAKGLINSIVFGLCIIAGWVLVRKKVVKT